MGLTPEGLPPADAPEQLRSAIEGWRCEAKCLDLTPCASPYLPSLSHPFPPKFKRLSRSQISKQVGEVGSLHFLLEVEVERIKWQMLLLIL